MTEIDGALDPARHLLVFTDYVDTPDGGVRSTPISLDAAGANFADMIMEGRKAEAGLDVDYPSTDDVGLSRNRARVIAALLEELAIRLEPGRAVGPIQSDGALSDVARGISSYLRAGY